MKHALLVLAVLTTVGITGCDDDEEAKPTKNIWELVQENSSLTVLEGQLEAADFDATLSADGEMTLFAPSDAAMNALLSTLGLDDFESVSSDVVQAVLAYHVANSQYLSSQLTNGASIPTLQGEAIAVVTSTTGEKKLHTGATTDATVTTADIKATNGVIHIVDYVLVPPSIGGVIVETLGTVAQPLLLGADFTILAAGMTKANAFAAGAGQVTITDILIGAEGSGFEDALLTVFAPTNGTFEAGGLTADSFTGQQWYGILRHHIVADDVTYGEASDYTVGGTFTTTLGANLTVLTTSAPTNPAAGILTGIALNSNASASTPEAQIAVLDVLTATGATPAENGVINVIAGVLSPN